MIHSLTGEFEIDSGIIRVFGQNIQDNFETFYQDLGVVFQEDIVLNEFSVKDMLLLFGTINSDSTSELQNKIDHISNMLNLHQSLDSKTDELSGGQKRKLMLALAILRQLNILVLDEPTSGVDANSRHEIWKTIGSMKNCTILVTSHALEESEQVSTKIVVMKTGQVAFSGSANDLRFE
jgi:ABC-2 type transport system ATP-binding protein